MNLAAMLLAPAVSKGFWSKVLKDFREGLESLLRVPTDCSQGEKVFLFRANNKDFVRPSLRPLT